MLYATTKDWRVILEAMREGKIRSSARWWEERYWREKAIAGLEQALEGRQDGAMVAYSGPGRFEGTMVSEWKHDRDTDSSRAIGGEAVRLGVELRRYADWQLHKEWGREPDALRLTAAMERDASRFLPQAGEAVEAIVRRLWPEDLGKAKEDGGRTSGLEVALARSRDPLTPPKERFLAERLVLLVRSAETLKGHGMDVLGITKALGL